MSWRKNKNQPRNKNTEARTPSRPVYSFYKSGERHDKESEKPIDLGKKNNKVRLMPTFIAAAVIIGSILFSLTLGTEPSVETLNNQPSPYRDLSEYAETADKLLQEDLINRTKFTIRTGDIEKKMLDSFPELKATALRLPVLGRKPTLVLDIRQPAILLSTKRQSFVLDSTGRAISEIRKLASEQRKGLPVVLDQSDIELKLGQQIIPSDTVKFIVDAKAQLEAKGMVISQLTLPASVNELDIHIEGIPYFVKTDTSGNPRLQLGSFIAVHDQLKKQGITPSEYVDARVEEKVFYK